MINQADETYKTLVRDVLEVGQRRLNERTGVGTLSVFGRQVRYNLSNNNEFPVLTTKQVHWKSVVGELLWFLRGDTNVAWLQQNGIKIWNDWATKEQCAKFGRVEGDLGPVYGELWRRWPTTQPDRKIDQIKHVVEQIKHNPESRRLIVTGWNPETCDQVALPPCHTLFQFNVDTSRIPHVLNCQLYQRSADLMLGVPFNVASYALLTHMIAQVCEMVPGEFVHTFGDLHVYLNHVVLLEEQLERSSFPAPRLVLNPTIKTIDGLSWGFEDITLTDYQHHKAIKAPVAV